MTKWWGTQHPYITPTQNYDQKIVIWAPTLNVDDPTLDAGTKYKDPLTVNNEWSEFFKMVDLIWKPSYDIQYINYRMPVRETLQHIKEADLCIGYEGIGNIIARTYWKPLVTFSSWNPMSRFTSGPWAKILERVNDYLMDPTYIINDQLGKIEQAEQEFWNNKRSTLTERLLK